MDEGVGEGVGLLLVGQLDVEPDGAAPAALGAAIGGLHDPRSAAGDDQQTMVLRIAGGTADDAAEIAGELIVAALVDATLSVLDLGRQLGVAGVGGQSVARLL